MLTTTEDTLTAFPAPATVICGCDEDAACSFHARALNMRTAMTILSCDCNGERACVMHADDLYDRGECEDHREEMRAFEDASADFYIPGWTPECQDDRDMDARILADMAAEAHDNPDMAHALLTLYPDDAFTAADLAAMIKADAKDMD
jgi:hypothetical protein